MRWRHLLILISAALTPCASLDASAALPMWEGLKPGGSPVAFEVLVVETIASSTPAAPSRPMRLLIWRPAQGGTGRPLQYGDYLSQKAAAGVPQEAAEKYVAKDLDSVGRNFSGANASELLERIRSVPVAARTNAKPARGLFPLVIHSLGRNGYQLENILLWEYLASKGFVVAVVPQLSEGIYTRGLKFDAADIQLQANDIVRAVDFMRNVPGVDRRRLFYTGHSSGAVAALVAAIQRPAIALASFDGSNASKDGVELMTSLPPATAAAAPPVLLQFYRLENQTFSPEWTKPFAQKKIYAVGFPKATHFDFQLWPLFSVLTGTEDERGKQVRPALHGAEVLRSSIALTGCAFEKLSRASNDLAKCFRSLPEGSEFHEPS